MPTYEVVSGDTVWALTRRALTEQYGRVPTNREILEVVNQVQVPSGNVDLIYPGEQITIPVGPGYEGGEGPGGGGAGGGGGTPGQTPNLPGGVRPEPGRPDGGIYTPIDPPYAGGMPGGGRQYPVPPAVRDPRPIPGGSPGGAVNAPAGGREDEIAAAAGEQFIDPYAAYRSQIRPAPFELDKYPESTYALGGLTAAALAGYGVGGLLGRGAAARGVSPAAQRALPSGGRPALPAGPPPPAGPATTVARTPSGAIPLGPGAASVPFRTAPPRLPQLGDAWGRYGTGYMF